MVNSIRWTVQDRYGNSIYLTQERWEHIIEPINHPEMEDYEEELKETVQAGIRKQDPLNPQKYRYTRAFDNLPANNTHIVSVVLFGLHENEIGEIESNNFIATAYQKEIG
jgi:hypothetical protein